MAAGHNKIDRFDPVQIDRIRLRVLRSAVPPVIRNLAAHRVQGVSEPLLKDYDPAGGRVPFECTTEVYRVFQNAILFLAGPTKTAANPSKRL